MEQTVTVRQAINGRISTSAIMMRTIQRGPASNDLTKAVLSLLRRYGNMSRIRRAGLRDNLEFLLDHSRDKPEKRLPLARAWAKARLEFVKEPSLDLKEIIERITPPAPPPQTQTAEELMREEEALYEDWER